jgi:hypothetical protein
VAIEEVADTGIATDQDELPRQLAWRNASSSQNTLHRDVDDVIGVPLHVARCTTCVSPAIAPPSRPRSTRAQPRPLRLVDDPSAAKRTDACTGTRLIGEQASDEKPPDLPGRARYQGSACTSSR